MKKTKLKITLGLLLIIIFCIPTFCGAATGNTEVEPVWINPAGSWPGYIFSTLDNNLSSWNHGHSGIGGNNGETIEAFQDYGVAVFVDGYMLNWRNCMTGGIYAVNNASDSQYTFAKYYAYNKEGLPYSLNVADGESAFYCSELVYRAWEYAGITVGTFASGIVTPRSIMEHSNTRLVYSF